MILAQYTCPICNLSLVLTERTLSCENNHCFDFAKENYVNLLPVQFKHSKNPGDNKAMVNARRDFLEKGYYQPLVEKLTSLYHQHHVNEPKTNHAEGIQAKLTNVLDAGCGEGFYTHQHKSNDNVVYGVDIAKEAIKKAAKKYPQCHFSVATLSKLPFEDNFFSWVFSIYAPILEVEFTRVIQKNGYLLTVTPAKQHLMELKKYIYLDAKEHNDEKTPIENLTLIHEERFGYQMELASGQDTLNLLSMTPFAFKASEQVKAQLALLSNFNCQADFLIRIFKNEH
jgi:23S rRNA (guanine745-N1)-methyltransferase